MKISFLGTCLAILATTNLRVTQALPSSSFGELDGAANETTDIVKRKAAGDYNCHGSGFCPILERNLFRALKVSATSRLSFSSLLLESTCN